MSERLNQNTKIERHLRNGNSITPTQALQTYGCFRLGARIFDLRKKGLDIRTRIINNGRGAKFAEYSLADR